MKIENEDILLEWIQTKRKHGTPVVYITVERTLGQLDKIFRENTPDAQKQVITRWAKRNNYVCRVKTHAEQRDPHMLSPC